MIQPLLRKTRPGVREAQRRGLPLAHLRLEEVLATSDWIVQPSLTY